MYQFGALVSICAGEKCVSLEHLLSMSVLMRNVSNCCEHQFGTPVVNVCADEKCVELL